MRWRPYGQSILVCGPSGAGKSTFATGLIERLIDRDYQICIVDPEGDYGTLDGIVTIGNRLRPPQVDEFLDRLGGASPAFTLGELAKALGLEPSVVPRTKRDEAIIWERSAGLDPWDS